jgi:TonB family protein
MRHSLAIATFVSLMIHGAIFFALSRPLEDSIAFQAGRSAIEVAQPGAAYAEKKGTGVAAPAVPRGEGPKVSPGQEGILDGSALGIPPPEYPSLSRLRGEQGEVLLNLWFNAEKELVEAEVEKSSGYSMLDQAAVAAVKKGLPSAKNPVRAQEKKIRFKFQLRK